MAITVFDNWSFGPTNDNTIGWVLDPRCYSLFFFTTCKKIYIQNNKNDRNLKKNYMSATV